MEQTWKKMILEREAGRDAVEGLIQMNLNDMQDHLSDFLDEVTSGEEFLGQITRLRTERNHLFDVKEDLDADIERLQGFINSVSEKGGE